MGLNIKSVIIFYLERKGVKFMEIPNDPKRFSDFLREIYGGAASVIERMIVKCLASKKGLVVSYTDFCSSLYEIKMKWEF